MNHIDIHELSGAAPGLEIMRLPEGTGTDAAADDIHRDDHYNFVVLESGRMEIMVDFQEFSLAAGEIYFIKPGQVHRRLSQHRAGGWFLAPDISLLPGGIRSVFESSPDNTQSTLLEPGLFRQAVSIICLIFERSAGSHQGNAFQSKATVALFQSFLNILAGGYRADNADKLSGARPEQLRDAFKNLVSANFKALKAPSEYAARLHVSVNYLNEVIKKSTGFTVSHWIAQDIVLEAKRLLTYTHLDVREIAGDLGYSDPAYFSRLFKKTTGESPLSFRAKNGE